MDDPQLLESSEDLGATNSSDILFQDEETVWTDGSDFEASQKT